MRPPRFRFTVRRMVVVVVFLALMFAFVYFHTVGSFYGPGGQLDREYDQAAREWRSAHPGQAYPSFAPTRPSPNSDSSR